MPITSQDVIKFPCSFCSSPILQETSTTYPCVLFLHNQTTKQVFVNIQEKRLSSLENPKIREKPISNQSISLNPLEKKIVTVFFQSVELMPISNATPFPQFQFPLNRELHIHSKSKGFIDCTSAIPVSLQKSKFSFNLLTEHLSGSPEDKFISAELNLK